MKLIDKSALVAEIEKMQDTYISKLESRGMKHEDAVIASVSYVNGIKDIINSIEVKEVDLEKEIQNHIKECLDVKFPTTDIELIKKDVAYTAKKFFKLGLQQSKKHNNNEE